MIQKLFFYKNTFIQIYASKPKKREIILAIRNGWHQNLVLFLYILICGRDFSVVYTKIFIKFPDFFGCGDVIIEVQHVFNEQFSLQFGNYDADFDCTSLFFLDKIAATIVKRHFNS